MALLYSILLGHGLDGNFHWLHAHPEACSGCLDQTICFLISKALIKAWALMLMVRLVHSLPVFMRQTDLGF